MRVLEVELLVVAQGLLKVRNNDKECNYWPFIRCYC